MRICVSKSLRPGQPRKYFPEELLQKFEEYCLDCRESCKLINITGFALYANIDKGTIYHYFDNEEYFNAKKIIEGRIEEEAMQMGLQARNPAFMIFYLKNKCGWRDKHETEISGPGGGPIQAQMSDEELDIKIKKLLGDKPAE